MNKETFIIRSEWWQSIKLLSKSERAILFDNLFLFHIGEESKMITTNLSVNLVWNIIEPSLIRNSEAYDKRIESARENGKKGGRPPKKPEETQQNQINQPVISDKPNNHDSVSVPVSVSVPTPVTVPASVPQAAKDFETFWEAYGKDVDRYKCEHAWHELTPEERRLALIRAPMYVASLSEPRYHMSPLKWLTNKRFNDDPKTLIPFNKPQTYKSQSKAL